MIKEVFEIIKKVDKKYIAMIAIAIILIVSFIIYKLIFNEKIQYTVKNSFIEKISENQANIILYETVLDIDNNSTLVPVIEGGTRVSKGDSIALYKNSEYENYLANINKMDLQIETLIKDLPTTYSADINSIDSQIAKYSKESLKLNSYVKMQEYKKKIDSLSETKVTLLAELSPQGSKIRELIEERKKLEKQLNNLSSSVTASISGVVNYKVDKLENNNYFKNISSLSIDEIKNIFEKYQQNDTNEFGIKIIDNYVAYIIIKEPFGPNDEYMKENKEYTIRIIDENYKELSGEIVTLKKDEQSNYIVFKIGNNIEDIYDTRVTSIEVVWKRVQGLYLPISAIKHNELTNTDYVTVLKYGNYVDIPIKIQLSNSSYSIVTNYSKEEIEEKNLDGTYILKLYDRVLIE